MEPPWDAFVYSISESEIETLVTIFFSGFLVSLIFQLLLCTHRVPNFSLLLVGMDEVLPLGDEDHQTERTDGDADFVAVLVVRLVPTAVDLTADETSTATLLVLKTPEELKLQNAYI